MAIGDPYATPEEYRALVGRTDPSDDEGVIKPLIARAQELIDARTGRQFNTGTAGATVYVDGNDRDWEDQSVLWIPDMAAITAIAVDEFGDGTFSTSISPAAAWLEMEGERGEFRYNADARGYPWVKLVLLPLAANTFGVKWPRGRRNIRLTGTEGFPAGPPGVIRSATCMLARQLRDVHKSGMSMVLPSMDSGVQLMPGALGILRDIEQRFGRRAPVAV